MVVFLKDFLVVKEVFYIGCGGMIFFKVVDEICIFYILNSFKVFFFVESLGGVESFIIYLMM